MYYGIVKTVNLMKTLIKRTVFSAPVIVKYMKKNLDITNPRFNELIWQVPSDFVKSGSHCTFMHASNREIHHTRTNQGKDSNSVNCYKTGCIVTLQVFHSSVQCLCRTGTGG